MVHVTVAFSAARMPVANLCILPSRPMFSGMAQKRTRMRLAAAACKSMIQLGPTAMHACLHAQSCKSKYLQQGDKRMVTCEGVR